VADGRPLHLDLELSREEYEDMIRPLIESTLDSVFQAMKDASKEPKDLDVILLVGGSTRIPLVRRILEERVGVPVRQDVHPELCVALGAGLLAARLAGHAVERVLVDVSPYSFGPSYLGMVHGEPYPFCYRPIIPRNTPLPVTRTERYYTASPHQKAVEVSIFQGDDPDALKNILVGNFRVEGLTRMQDQNEVLCRMSLDLDGILRVEAIEKCTGRSRHITIRNATKTKTEQELARARQRLADLYQEGLGPFGPILDVDDDATEVAAEVLDSTDQAEPQDTPHADPGFEAQRAEAERLTTRSRDLLDQVHDEDKEEIVDLHDRIQEAIEIRDIPSLSGAVKQLRELLFFIEGRP